MCGCGLPGDIDSHICLTVFQAWGGVPANVVHIQKLAVVAFLCRSFWAAGILGWHRHLCGAWAALLSRITDGTQGSHRGYRAGSPHTALGCCVVGTRATGCSEVGVSWCVERVQWPAAQTDMRTALGLVPQLKPGATLPLE